MNCPNPEFGSTLLATMYETPVTSSDDDPCAPPFDVDDGTSTTSYETSTTDYGYSPGLPSGPSPHLLDGDHWEGEVAVEGAPEHGMSASDLAGSSVGLAVALGHQFGPVRLAGEYSFAKVSGQRDLYTDDLGGTWWDGWQDVSGESSRLGASARVRGILGMGGDASGFGGNLAVYGEVGAGRETIHWDGGAELHRDDVAVGAGFEMAFGNHHLGGLDLGARLLIAPAATPATVPACSGICMQTTDDQGHDVAVLMHAGILFGG